MDELTERYRRGLGERLEALSADRASLARSRAARKRVRSIAHSLKGSGGTYGFPEITAAAAAVEAAPDAGLRDALDALVAILRREAAAPESRPAPADGPSGGTAGPHVVLVVDDDPDVTRLLTAVLSAPGREIRVLATAAEAEQAVRGQPVALIVLDLMLPDADGRSFLARLRDEPSTAAVPVIVLSGHVAAQARTECYALGAEAFIVKPFDPSAVATTVAAILERTGRFGHDARLDPVTALPNRVAFREAFDQATASRASGRGPIAVALLELDQYRPLAASSGWGSADRALAFAARSLARALAGASIVARWTGGAFAVLLAGLGEEDAAARIAAALRAVRDETPADRVAPRFTFSAGVAEWTEGSSLAESLAEAESQVVAARAAGGDVVQSSVRPGAAARRVVLLAEDDDLIASVLKHRLERGGLAVEHFSDGASAAAAAAKLRPALAILDVKMPGMDGFELLGRLRGEAALARMPIMMLTSMGNEQDVVRGLALGADDYVVKPFSPVEVVARVHRLLLRR